MSEYRCKWSCIMVCCTRELDRRKWWSFFVELGVDRVGGVFISCGNGVGWSVGYG